MIDKVLILICFIANLFFTNLYSQNFILINSSNKGINVIVNNKERLINGFPLIEDINTTFNEVYSSDKQIKYIINTNKALIIDYLIKNKNILILRMNLPKGEIHNGKTFAGFFWDSITGFNKGVEVWRYKPWNSWTKPIKCYDPSKIHDWDVQFFYWQFDDGLYGAAIPLCGNGYRTSLGAENNKFGCKSYTYTKEASSENIPLMVLGFDDNPYRLFSNIYEVAFKNMNIKTNLLKNKVYPEVFEYIGWCTWNATNMGRDLNESYLINSVKTFTDKGFPLGWILIDDGWFIHDRGRLNSFLPDTVKFPNGFKPLIKELNSNYGLKYFGIWHAYNGYWNGINPNSNIGQKYKNELFSWKQHERIETESPYATYYFIKPTSHLLNTFYDDWHKYFKEQGFNFVKVDNQLVSERMSVDNYPIWFLSEKMHKALYRSVFKHFNGAIINCMDMTSDAYYNFYKSAIGRTVEDYFPERDGGFGYNLERGGAAAHVLMALYNALYFSQFVYPDFDMFESYNTYANFHACARAISGGPIYITDIPGKQKFNILWPLIDHEGKILRVDKPAMLTEDCLFQLQDPKPLKAFSFIEENGILAVFNAADADTVEGLISPSDLYGLKGDSFAVYEYFSKKVIILNKKDIYKITLSRMDCQYYSLIPIKYGIAVFGITDKLNAPKTITKLKIRKSFIEVSLSEGGTFKALLPTCPSKIMINNLVYNNFTYENGVLTLNYNSNNKLKILIIL